MCDNNYDYKAYNFEINLKNMELCPFLHGISENHSPL